MGRDARHIQANTQGTYDDFAKVFTHITGLSIGTTDPQGRFHVVGPDGPVTTFPTVGGKDVMIFENDGNVNFGFVCATGSGPAIKWYISAGATHDGLLLYDVGTKIFRIDTNGVASQFIIDGSGNAVAKGRLQSDGGFVRMAETTAPTPVTGKADIYPHADNSFRFTDGAGNGHIFTDAFAGLRYASHLGAATWTPSAANAWTLFNSFNLATAVDDIGNASASTGTGRITVGSAVAGSWRGCFSLSANSTSGTKHGLFGIGIDSSLSLSSTTATTPIVATIAAGPSDHNLQDGDGVVISGVTGGTPEANGSFIVDRQSATTFALYSTVQPTPVAVAGTGGAGSGGTVDVIIPGDWQKGTAYTTAIQGHASTSGIRALAASDVLGLYLSASSTDAVSAAQVSFNAERVGD